jgi:hypothetical protein
MSTITEFLFAAPASRSAPAIIAWWERRRLAYNAWVGAGGAVSLGTVSLFGLLSGETEMFPGVLFASAVFGVMANACYLLGPMIELFVEKVWGRSVLPVGPLLYRMGLTFSVGLALFPTLLIVLLATARVVLAVLGLDWD